MTRLLAALTVVLAQSLAAQTPYVESFEVRIQNLDVVVTDRAGTPVRGLTKNDFVVLEDGATQEISNFAAYDESAATVATTGAQPFATPPPPRHVVFFIDELTLHPASRAKLVENAMHLLESLPPTDRAMVVTATGTHKVLQELTNDRAAIRRALENVMAASHPRANTQVASDVRFLETQMRMSASSAERRWARRRYASMVKRRVEQRLGSLRALVASLSALEGKKVLVLITNGIEARPGAEEAVKEQVELVSAFSSTPAPAAAGEVADSSAPLSTIAPTVYDLRPLIADLGRTAATNGVTIYPLQPDVLLELAAPGGAEGRRGSTNYRGPADWSRILRNNEMTMTSLAETTGGRWFRGDGRIDDVFRQVSSDIRSYYSLAYRVKAEKDRPRRVEVRVKNHPELNVRTRSEAVEKSTDGELEDLTMATLIAAHPVNELAVVASADKPERRRDIIAIPVEVAIPMEKLTFLPTANNRYMATFRVYYAVSGITRDFMAGEQREQKVDISEDEYDQLEGKVFRYSSEVLVTPGAYRIAVGVFDLTSRLSGFDSETVDAR